ncbi:hypothetical protein J1614_000910 [Plenodomus biglobosus]|nr:hypothetical protein J1614_000910 [Plenodomus biglobosus]
MGVVSLVSSNWRLLIGSWLIALNVPIDTPFKPMHQARYATAFYSLITPWSYLVSASKKPQRNLPFAVSIPSLV